MACSPNADGVVVEGDCDLKPGKTVRFYAPEDDAPPEEPPVLSIISPQNPARLPRPNMPDTQSPATEAPTADQPAPEQVVPSDVADAPVENKSESSDENLTATTEVAAPSGLDADAMSKLAGAAGGDTTMLVVLGVIGLAGAGTTWKFLTQWSEQRHEQKMKQLDISERSQGLGSAQPPPCQAANAKLIADMEALTARLAAVEKKSMTLSADFDGEDLERQVKKLSKTVKAIQEEGKH